MEDIVHLAHGCDIRPSLTTFTPRTDGGPPVIEYWVRPKGVAPDVFFALSVRRRVGAGDVRREPNGMGADGSAHRVSACAARRRLAARVCARRRRSARTGSTRTTSSSTARAASSCRAVNWRWCRQVVTPEASRSRRRAHAMLARMARIAIVGGGSIGEALLSGLLRAGRQVKDLVVAEKSPDRAKYLSDTYSVLGDDGRRRGRHRDLRDRRRQARRCGSVVGEIADAAAKAESDTAEQVFVSVVAGVTTEFYENKLPAGSPVIRVMPNAPVVVGGESARWRAAASPPPITSRRCRRSSMRSAAC